MFPIRYGNLPYGAQDEQEEKRPPAKDQLLPSTASAKIKTRVARTGLAFTRSFDEPFKFLPVAFMLSIMFSLWFIYVAAHCLPLLELVETRVRGWICLTVMNTLFALLLSCYIRSIITHPGSIPDKETCNDESWEVSSSPRDPRLAGNLLEGVVFMEKKRAGARRDCKWCGKYKPDRCHHCRVCRMCVLKMDHHCPWIYNCVGFGNFKYFFLLIVYSCITLHFLTWTMLDTVRKAMEDPSTPFFRMFVLLFGETLAGFVAFLLTLFVGFHIYLMLNALTTIEFCEKSRKSNTNQPCYSRGVLGNIKAVLGDAVLLWFLPLSPPSGDGINFVTEETPLRLKEEGHEYRRKAHAMSSSAMAVLQSQATATPPKEAPANVLAEGA